MSVESPEETNCCRVSEVRRAGHSCVLWFWPSLTSAVCLTPSICSYILSCSSCSFSLPSLSLQWDLGTSKAFIYIPACSWASMHRGQWATTCLKRCCSQSKPQLLSKLHGSYSHNKQIQTEYATTSSRPWGCEVLLKESHSYKSPQLTGGFPTDS